MAYVVRATEEPAALAPSIRRIVASLDPLLPVYDIRPLREYVDGARAAQRFTMLLATVFACVAILLAAVGIYGVIAYATTRRRYEFGIRLALGATPRQVVGMVLREGVALAAIGLAAGAIVAAAVARWLDAQLFGVSPRDVPSFAAAAAAIAAAALLACWVPARRASKIRPSEALGSDTAA
jgi:putative ABC transport system permease protein